MEVTLTGGRCGGNVELVDDTGAPWELGTLREFLFIDDEGRHIECSYRRDADTYAVFIEEIFLA